MILNMSVLQEYRSLPGPIWAMAAARMVNAMGSFVYPFLTLLLTDKLKFDEGNAGRILMIATVMFVPGSLIGGWLADRVGRKRLLITAQVIGALCLGLVGFMPFTSLIIWPILIQNFFFGLMMPASSAITYDLTGPENRKTAFSLLYLAMNLGFAVGPFLAGYLYETHARWLFIGDAGTTLGSLVFIIILVPETLGSSSGKPHPILERPEHGSAARLLLKRPILLSFVALMAVPWFIYGQHSFTLPLFSKELFPETGALLYGKMMSLNAVFVVLFTVPIIGITKRFRPIINVAFNALLYALGFGMLAFFHSPAAFYLSVLIWTSGEILGATNVEVFTANHTPSSHRGRFASILPLISGSGRALSPWITGVLLLTRPTSYAWKLSLTLGMSAAAGFLILGFIDKHRGVGAEVPVSYNN